MRRRELLAGLGSIGVLGGAGLVAIEGVPSVENRSEHQANGEAADRTETDPITIETITAPGSRDGQVTIPASDRSTFIDFFGTWCPPCVEQMPALAEANKRVGNSVLFISVTTEAVGRSVAKRELVNWWKTHDGNWLLGVDQRAALAARYLEGGYPSAVAIDASGKVQWSKAGVKTADQLVAGIRQAL
ncbi:TlpA family protein disulfide reductase [Halocatena pleomorpha]|uniref:TlpA family protein disulfide reductase n=1 Tax=Halocatena pleomorpha TaxID=1785090 RepID=A0A3P3R7W5_9EURY|nr:TlpA disulfide reductase family protein [Halocatena pleomorpha]RRJ29562.1 TlpA family protein disulfide reductase [Halocatena pleomorpha]